LRIGNEQRGRGEQCDEQSLADSFHGNASRVLRLNTSMISSVH
jgi:hypothetical protein